MIFFIFALCKNTANSMNNAIDTLVGNRRNRRGPPPANPAPQRQHRARPQNSIKFVHSNNVIIKKGTYIGYFGTVTGYTPAMTRVEVDVPQTLEVSRVSVTKVPSNVAFPESIVVINEPYLKVAYQNEYLYQIVRTTGTACFVRPLTFNGMKIKSLEKLAQIIKQHSTNASDGMAGSDDEMAYEMMMNEPVVEIPRESCHFYLPEYIVMTSNKYNGFIGQVNNILNNQMINTKTQKSNIDNENKIKHGPYRGLTVHISGREPARLRIRIEATSREETHLMDSNYAVTPITPDDVFYMDVRLNSGNFFQVNRIINQRGELVFIGVERVMNRNANGQTVTNLESRQIGQGDIAEMMPGFSHSAATATTGQRPSRLSVEVPAEDEDTEPDEDAEMVEYIGQQSNNAEPNTPVDDDDNENAEDSFEEPEETENTEEQSNEGRLPQSSSNSSLVSSYSDKDRVEAVGPELNNEQTVIRGYLNRIANLFYREDMTVMNLINEIVNAVREAALKFGRSQNWNPSDDKFISAVFFLRHMIRNGRGNLIGRGRDRVDQYVRRLIKAKIFNTNDIQSSIFSNAGERRNEATIRNMFNRAVDFVNQNFGNVLLDQDYTVRESDLIPLNNARQREQAANASTRLVNVRQVMENEIPQNASKIYWPNEYVGVFERNEKILQREENMRKDKKGKQVYKFVKKHLRQAPIQLKRLGKMPDTEMNRIKYNALKTTFEKTYPSLKKRYEEIQSNKAKKIKTINDNKEELLRKRQNAVFVQKLTGKVNNLQIQGENVAEELDNIEDQVRQQISDKLKYDEMIQNMKADFGSPEFIRLMETREREIQQEQMQVDAPNSAESSDSPRRKEKSSKDMIKKYLGEK